MRRETSRICWSNLTILLEHQGQRRDFQKCSALLYLIWILLLTSKLAMSAQHESFRKSPCIDSDLTGSNCPALTSRMWIRAGLYSWLASTQAELLLRVRCWSSFCTDCAETVGAFSRKNHFLEQLFPNIQDYVEFSSLSILAALSYGDRTRIWVFTGLHFVCHLLGFKSVFKEIQNVFTKQKELTQKKTPLF